MSQSTLSIPAAHPSQPGASVWPALAAVMVAIVLLLAFGHVVQQGVQQGQTRREAEARQAAAQWRCYRPADRLANDDCTLASPLPQALNSRRHSFLTTP